MSIIEEARGFIKEKRYNFISENMMDVGKNIVCLKVKQGRSILTCSCQNDSRFCNESPICSHKWVFIAMTTNKRLYEEIDKSIASAKRYKEMSLPINHLICLDILEGIKGAK